MKRFTPHCIAWSAVTLLLLVVGFPGCPTEPVRAVPEDPELPLRTGEEIDSLLAATPDGGELVLPRALYRVRRPILLDRPLRLRGEPGTVLELVPGTSTSVLEIRSREPGGRVRGVTVEDLRIHGNRAEQRAGSGVTLLRADACALRRLEIRDCSLDGVYASDVHGSVFEALTLVGCGRNGLSFGEAVPEPASSGNRVVRCTAEGNGLIGFDAEPGVRNRFEECAARRNASYGFSVGAKARSRGNAIIGCSAEGNADSGINVWCDSTEVRDCDSRGNGFDGISIIGPEARGNRVVDCRTRSNARHGIGLDRAFGTLLRGNLSEGNGTSGLGDGIALVAGVPVSDNHLVGNRVLGSSHRYALVITELVQRTRLEGNHFEGSLSVTARDVEWQ